MYKIIIISNTKYGVIKMDEDEITEYGEFVCSFDKWLPIEVQRERAKRLAKITKKEDKKQ